MNNKILKITHFYHLFILLLIIFYSKTLYNLISLNIINFASIHIKIYYFCFLEMFLIDQYLYFSCFVKLQFANTNSISLNYISFSYQLINHFLTFFFSQPCLMSFDKLNLFYSYLKYYKSLQVQSQQRNLNLLQIITQSQL